MTAVTSNFDLSDPRPCDEDLAAPIKTSSRPFISAPTLAMFIVPLGRGYAITDGKGRSAASITFSTGLARFVNFAMINTDPQLIRLENQVHKSAMATSGLYSFVRDCLGLTISFSTPPISLKSPMFTQPHPGRKREPPSFVGASP